MVALVAGEVHFGLVARVGICEKARGGVIWFALRNAPASRGRASPHKTKVHQTKVHYPCRLVGANVGHDRYIPH